MNFAVKVVAFELMLISWTIIFCGWRKNMGSEISPKNDNLTIRLETTIKAAICELSQYRGAGKPTWLIISLCTHSVLGTRPSHSQSNITDYLFGCVYKFVYFCT